MDIKELPEQIDTSTYSTSSFLVFTVVLISVPKLLQAVVPLVQIVFQPGKISVD